MGPAATYHGLGGHKSDNLAAKLAEIRGRSRAAACEYTKERRDGVRCRTEHPNRRSSGDLVEVAGIEPASFGTSPGLLRAQPALLFSAPAVTQASHRRAQSLLGVPLSPATGLSGGSS